MLRRLSPLLLVLALTGCGLFRAAPPAAPSDAVLILINRTAEPIQYVYLARCDHGDWGADWLGADEVVMPGQTRTFTLDPGCWDFRAVLRDERVIDERGIAMLRNSQRTWALFPEDG